MLGARLARGRVTVLAAGARPRRRQHGHRRLLRRPREVRAHVAGEPAARRRRDDQLGTVRCPTRSRRTRARAGLRRVAGHPLQQHGAGLGSACGAGARERQAPWRTATRCAARSCSRMRRSPKASPASATRVAASHGSTRGSSQRLDLEPGDKLSVGEATLTVGADRSSRSRKSRPDSLFATGPRAADPRRRPRRDQPAATWQSRDVAVARRGPHGAGRSTAFRTARRARRAAGPAPGERARRAPGGAPDARSRRAIPRLAALVAVHALRRRGSRSPRRATCAVISTRPRCSAASARPERRTLALFVAQFVALGIVASALGVVLALGRPGVAGVACSRRSRPSQLPAPSFMPARRRFATGVLLLFGFALPPLIALASVPPLRVLRRDLPRPRRRRRRLRTRCAA